MNSLKENYPTFLLNYLLNAAPMHNMFAECTLTLSDFHLRRASNVQMGFVDGIVKSKINATMKQSKTQFIAFSIKQAQRAKMLCKQHKAHIANIQRSSQQWFHANLCTVLRVN